MHPHAQLSLIFPLNQEVLFLNQDSTFISFCQGGSVSLSMPLVDGVAVPASVAIVVGMAVVVSDKPWLLRLSPEFG